MSRERLYLIISIFAVILNSVAFPTIYANTDLDPKARRLTLHPDFSQFRPTGQPVLPDLVEANDLPLSESEAEDLLISESIGPANFKQDSADVAGLYGGRAAAVWEDNRLGPTGIFIQLFDNSGNPLGGNSDLILGEEIDLQKPVICADTNGFFFVVWRESKNGYLQAARFDSNGTATTDIFFVSDTSLAGFAGEFDAACMPDGKLVATWEQYTVGSNIEFRIFNTDGTPLTDAVLVNSDGTLVKHWSPGVAIGSNNDIAITWEDYRTGKADIFLRIYNSSGVAYSAEFSLSDESARDFDRYIPDIVYSEIDGYFVGWTDLREGVNIYIQRVSPAGILVDLNVLMTGVTAQDENWEVDLAISNTNRLSAVWTLYDEHNVILLQKFFANLQMQGSPQEVSDGSESRRSGPSVTAAHNGNIIILWTKRSTGSKDIRAIFLDADGSTIRSIFTVNDDLSGSPSFDPDVAGYSRFEWEVVFTDQRRDDGDIMLQRIYVGGELIGGNRRVNGDGPGGIQSEPAIAAANDFMCVCWTDNRGTSRSQNIVCRFLHTAMDLTDEIIVNDDGGSVSKYSPDVAINEDSITITAWVDKRQTYPRIYGQVFDDTFQKINDNFLIGPSPSGEIGEMPVAFVWDELSFFVAYLNQTISGVEVKKVSIDGLVTDAFTFTSDRPGYFINSFDITRSQNDELYLVWQGYNAGQTGLFLTVLDSEGQIKAGTRTITDNLDAQPGKPSVAINHEGYLLVSWLDQRTGTGTPFRQIFDLDLNPLQGNVPTYSETGPYMQAPVSGAVFGRGIFIWADARENGLNIYGTLLLYSPTDADNWDEILPVGYSLAQNFPNPFNPTTTIHFSVPRSQRVTIDVLNLLGQKIRTLIDDTYPAGEHRVIWDGKDKGGEIAASGMYFYRLRGEGYVETRQMLLMK